MENKITNKFWDIFSPENEKKLDQFLLQIKMQLILLSPSIIKGLGGFLKDVIIYSISVASYLIIYANFGFERTLISLLVGVILFASRRNKG